MAESRVRRPPRGHFDLPRKRSNVTAHRSRVRRPRAGISTRAIASLTKVTQMVAGTTPPRGHFDRMPPTSPANASSVAGTTPPRGHFDEEAVVLLAARFRVAGTTPPRGHFDGCHCGCGVVSLRVAGTTPPRGHFDEVLTCDITSPGVPSRVRRPRAGISTSDPAMARP